MAIAMRVFCRYREHEFSVFDVPEDVKDEFYTDSHRALSIDPSSYFAHLIAAVVHQDLKGEYDAALAHAATALELNPGFSQATAMLGIAKIHLGEAELGLAMLRNGINAAPEDPHRFRHLRELAIGLFISGEVQQAAAVIDRLLHQAPDLSRNQLVSVPILLAAGRDEEAQRRVAEVIRLHPGITQQSMRQIRIREPEMADHFSRGLTAAGLA
jgi:tetratricopeptide (TPR) repeat protein